VTVIRAMIAVRQATAIAEKYITIGDKRER
jgi:hypothetical protein